MNLKATRIAWVDVESTGISPKNGDSLLQVASIVTDGNLEEVGPGFEAKIRYAPDEVATMYERAVPFVQEMHTVTGLWEALPHEGRELKEVDEALLAFFKEQGVEKGTARLGGNSISLDHDFMGSFLPKSLGHLHYRNYDMTSIAGFFELYRPEVPAFVKTGTAHEAMDDIRMSIAEGRHYRSHLESF